MSDTSSNCVTLNQSRWVVKHRDSTYWQSGGGGGQWVTGVLNPVILPAQWMQVSYPSDGMMISVQDTATSGSAVYMSTELAVEPNTLQEISFGMEVEEGEFILQALEEVSGTMRLLGSVTMTPGAIGTDGSITTTNYTLNIVPQTASVQLRVFAPFRGVVLPGSGTSPGLGTPTICCGSSGKGKWVTVKIPYLEQENFLVTLCDSLKDRYRFGFNSMEKMNEWSGIGNTLDFGARIYDSRLGRFLSVDPKTSFLPSYSPYMFALNTPIQAIDENGEFPILINGNTPDGDFLRASPRYWNQNTRNIISKRTGYRMGESFDGTKDGVSRFSGDFLFVDGNRGFGANTRIQAGYKRGKVDAQMVWNKMKETMQDGKITEQLQVISHSRGSAFASGYMLSLAKEIEKLAESEGIGFAYEKNAIIQYSVNLAPHQSNSIHFFKSGTTNVNISHVGDPLSGNDATGSNVINVHSIPEEDMGPLKQHQVKNHNTELDFTLEILEGNPQNSDDVSSQLSNAYKTYDSNRTNGGTSTVTSTGN